MNSDRETLDVLKDILKNQELQLQRQKEALAIILPIIVLLIAYLTWLIFR